ncbi:MAG TPA: hypothetical protein VK698_23760 [Kofleriaceae bacterium]|nr:hypothetical protein [Kofleriaceae bacterium]
MAVAGDVVVIAGSTCEGQPDQAAGPAFVALHDLDGTLTDVRGLGIQPAQPGTEGRAFVIAAGPDGRVAVGGTFEGAIDFGGGPITTDPSIEIQGYLAVFGPSPGPASVD